MKKGIDLKQFKKWIQKDIGDKPCKGFTFDCLNCFAWDVYEKLEALLWFIDFLDKENTEKRIIRRMP